MKTLICCKCERRHRKFICPKCEHHACTSCKEAPKKARGMFADAEVARQRRRVTGLFALLGSEMRPDAPVSDAEADFVVDLSAQE